MLEAILSFAIRQRWLVMIGVLIMAADHDKPSLPLIARSRGFPVVRIAPADVFVKANAASTRERGRSGLIPISSPFSGFKYS